MLNYSKYMPMFCDEVMVYGSKQHQGAAFYMLVFPVGPKNILFIAGHEML